MTDTIELESLDAYEEDTLVDLHVWTPPGFEGDTTRIVEFAELARLLDRKSTI